MSPALKVATGIGIINELQNGADIDAQHDIIYVGTSEAVEKMSDIMRVLMTETLGWHVDGENQCWAIFV